MIWSPSPVLCYKCGFPRKKHFFRKLKLGASRPMYTNTFHAILHAQSVLLLGEHRYTENDHENSTFPIRKQNILLINITSYVY